jgi:hypothetical protein
MILPEGWMNKLTNPLSVRNKESAQQNTVYRSSISSV